MLEAFGLVLSLLALIASVPLPPVTHFLTELAALLLSVDQVVTTQLLIATQLFPRARLGLSERASRPAIVVAPINGPVSRTAVVGLAAIVGLPTVVGLPTE